MINNPQDNQNQESSDSDSKTAIIKSIVKQLSYFKSIFVL